MNSQIEIDLKNVFPLYIRLLFFLIKAHPQPCIR